ncbi:MAG: cyclase [Acidimicrobiia bacterium]|nr:cyclase [Acidimicrobiia bacterium]
MATVAVRQTVSDYDAWKVVYDEHGTNRKEHGCTGDKILRDETDPTEVLVLTHWPSMKNAHEFASDPSLREAMSRAGVGGAPRIEFYEEAGA